MWVYFVLVRIILLAIGVVERVLFIISGAFILQSTLSKTDSVATGPMQFHAGNLNNRVLSITPKIPEINLNLT